MNRALGNFFAIMLLLVAAVQANAKEILFVPASDAGLILSTKDAFLTRMSPFDRAARMKTDRDATEAQFGVFAASAALDWDEHEKKAVKAAFNQVEKSIARLLLPLPDKIYVIKSSGKEEGNAAYTRENAIVLPKDMLAYPDREIQRLLAHELFHIFSRTHPRLVKSLYESIGFHYCGEVEFPANLALRKITNPDAPNNDYCIKVTLGSEKVLAIPIMFSRVSKYDVSQGGEFFQYLQFAFLLVEQRMDAGTPRVLYDSRGPRLAGLQQVSGFFEQVGQNTKYIVHPEEILADNFALLALGVRDVSSPEVLTGMERILANASEAGPRRGH